MALPPSPEAIAHRGLHDTVPENTLEAFSRALAAGAAAVELDVHATRDGVIVVHHDPVIAGRAAEPARSGTPIARLTLKEVKSFDLGGGARVPRLDETLELLRGHAIAYVELKGRGIEELVVRVIRAGGGTCAVHSFDHRAIARLSTVEPEIARGILEKGRPPDPVERLTRAHARDLWQQVHAADPRLVAEVHAAGGRVIAWTANSVAEWVRLRAAGVDGICTDRVDGLVAWLRDTPA